jgi:hypothetical protein
MSNEHSHSGVCLNLPFRGVAEGCQQGRTVPSGLSLCNYGDIMLLLLDLSTDATVIKAPGFFKAVLYLR